MDSSVPSGVGGLALAGYILGRWIVGAIRNRGAGKRRRAIEAAAAARQEAKFALAASRARKVRPLPHTRIAPPGAVIDSTGETNPRIPIWHGAPPHMRRPRLPSA